MKGVELTEERDAIRTAHSRNRLAFHFLAQCLMCAMQRLYRRPVLRPSIGAGDNACAHHRRTVPPRPERQGVVLDQPSCRRLRGLQQRRVALKAQQVASRATAPHQPGRSSGVQAGQPF